MSTFSVPSNVEYSSRLHTVSLISLRMMEAAICVYVCVCVRVCVCVYFIHKKYFLIKRLLYRYVYCNGAFLVQTFDNIHNVSTLVQ